MPALLPASRASISRTATTLLVMSRTCGKKAAGSTTYRLHCCQSCRLRYAGMPPAIVTPRSTGATNADARPAKSRQSQRRPRQNPCRRLRALARKRPCCSLRRCEPAVSAGHQAIRIRMPQGMPAIHKCAFRFCRASPPHAYESTGGLPREHWS